MENKQIDAVLESDLEKLLKGLGIYDELVSGNLKCAICGEKVTQDNIMAIYPENGEIKLACDKPACQKIIKEKTNG